MAFGYNYISYTLDTLAMVSSMMDIYSFSNNTEMLHYGQLVITESACTNQNYQGWKISLWQKMAQPIFLASKGITTSFNGFTKTLKLGIVQKKGSVIHGLYDLDTWAIALKYSKGLNNSSIQEQFYILLNKIIPEGMLCWHTKTYIHT